ncbi:MAG: MFS transporter [Verrucomicrobiota bacterium]|nr:MFS transporter [Verrucomicrobiota bacterium]
MSSTPSQETLQQVEAEDEGLPPPQGWRKAFSALRNPNYRHFYLGQTVSLTGTWTRTAALGWIAFQFTRSEFLLGVVFMLNSLPIFLFAVYAGSLADRIPKIRIFTLTSWFSLLSSLTLAVLLFRGPVPIVWLMVFAFLWGSSMAFEMPARQTLMVELVGKKDLVNAIALNSAMVNASRVVGPAIGGLLLASFGAAWCFLLDALSYLAVLYAIHKIQLPASHYAPRTVKADWKYTLEGFKYLKANPAIAQAVILLFIMGLGGWAYRSQLSAFAVTQLKMDAQGYGWLLALNGLGACAAALFVAAEGSRIVRAKTLYTGAGIYAAFIVLFGFMRHPVGAAFLLFFAGYGITLFFSIGNSIIQTQSPDHLRGRLMGIWALVFGGSMPVGSFWMGVLAQRVGSGHALQAGGLFCAVGSLVVFLLGRRNLA